MAEGYYLLSCEATNRIAGNGWADLLSLGLSESVWNDDLF